MRKDKEIANQAGVPKMFRQYARHYGSSVADLLQTHKKNPVEALDHGRDRAEQFKRMASSLLVGDHVS